MFSESLGNLGKEAKLSVDRDELEPSCIARGIGAANNESGRERAASASSG